MQHNLLAKFTVRHSKEASTLPPSPLPKVAILLAVYNGMLWIKNQVDSILQQQEVELTLYISVDPSTDSSDQWCTQLSTTYTNVILIERGVSLLTPAQNFFHLITSVDVCSYDYVGFSDQDDIWLNNKVHAAIMALHDNQCDGYSSNVEAFWSNGKTELIDKAQKQKKWDHFFEAAGPGCTYIMNNTLICAIQKCLLSNKLLSEKLGYHDWFCYAFARERNFQWFIDNNCYIRYRQHTQNALGANQGLKAFFRRSRNVLSGDAMQQAKKISRMLRHNETFEPSLTLPISRLDYLSLAFNYLQCRRHWKDSLLFFVYCLLSVIILKKPKH
jgi:rhamnosyltransferase